MHSASIIRTNNARFGQGNLVTVENSMTRVQMLNHSPMHQQHAGQHQIIRLNSDMAYSGNNTYQGYSFGNGSISSFEQQQHRMMPMAQMLPMNATYQQQQPMLMYDNEQSRNHYQTYIGQSSNPRDSRSQRSRSDISELTDVHFQAKDEENESTRRSTFSFEDEEGTRSNSTTNRNERTGSKLQRSSSSKSLTFNESEQRKMPPSSVRTDNLPSLASKISSDDGTNTSSGVKSVKSTKEESEQMNIRFLNEMKSIQDLDADDPAMMRTFLMRPCPKSLGTIKCYIKRNKGLKNALFPEYRVYLQDTNTFLMTSKKRMGNTTSNYLISMGRNDCDNRNSPNVLGKVRSNFLGTEYLIYDGGRNPQYENSGYDDDGDLVRCELGAISYASGTSLGAKGPRNLIACIGNVDSEGNQKKVWQPKDDSDEHMATCLKDKESPQNKNLISFVNKPPTWNETVKNYVFNFNGRKTLASVKNFQLIDESDPEKIFLQFGRIGKEEFALDLQWPLSPFQAFAFALSSFDSKLGCD